MFHSCHTWHVQYIAQSNLWHAKHTETTFMFEGRNTWNGQSNARSNLRDAKHTETTFMLDSCNTWELSAATYGMQNVVYLQCLPWKMTPRWCLKNVMLQVKSRDQVQPKFTTRTHHETQNTMERMQTNMPKSQDTNAFHNRIRSTMPYLTNHIPRHHGHWPNQKQPANLEPWITRELRRANQKTKPTTQKLKRANQELKHANHELPQIRNYNTQSRNYNTQIKS